MRFKNREQAGEQLARKLIAYRGKNTVVLGLPRGGVPVAGRIAGALGAPLDVLVARKIGAPGQPEFAIGAVTAKGTRVLNEALLRHFLLPPGYLEEATRVQQAEAQKRETRLRGLRPRVPLTGKTVILVDDGIATGMTMQAAIRDVRREHPGLIVIATPVIAPDSYETLMIQVEGMIVLAVPETFEAVGQFYEDFRQTTDEEVQALLTATV
jgi:putative phosphoribosyl transferase